MPNRDRDMTSPDQPGRRDDRLRDDETIGRDRRDDIRSIADDEVEDDLEDMEDLEDEGDEGTY